jgi:8-oxo-dGTP diphosphatase
MKRNDGPMFERPSVTVDLVIFTVMDGELNALFIKRGQEPFAGHWALPGGFVRPDESLEDAALRELEEETGIGLDAKDVYLEQVYTFGNPRRDIRTRVITVAHFALLNSSYFKPHVTGKEQITDVKWFPAYEPPSGLAFDHADILGIALARLRNKLEYTAVGFELVAELFTLTELQRLYEAILREKLDKRNFRKKILSMGIIQPTKQYREGGHRPAMLYRFHHGRPKSTFKRIVFEKDMVGRKRDGLH